MKHRLSTCLQDKSLLKRLCELPLELKIMEHINAEADVITEQALMTENCYEITIAEKQWSLLIRSRTIIYDPVQGSTCMNASIDNFVAIPTFDVVCCRMMSAYMGE